MSKCSKCLFSRLYARKPEPENNEELMARLMRFPKSGPLMHVFILTALDQYAKYCINKGPIEFDSEYMSGTAWVRCAQELSDNISKHLSERT